MSVDLKLTDEQARWLREHLDGLLEDAHWDRGELKKDEDAKEHAQTIHDKIKKIEDARKW